MLKSKWVIMQTDDIISFFPGFPEAFNVIFPEFRVTVQPKSTNCYFIAGTPQNNLIAPMSDKCMILPLKNWANSQYKRGNVICSGARINAFACLAKSCSLFFTTLSISWAEVTVISCSVANPIILFPLTLSVGMTAVASTASAKTPS